MKMKRQGALFNAFGQRGQGMTEYIIVLESQYSCGFQGVDV